MAMAIRVLRVRTRPTGVMVGLALTVFFINDLLLRCGDVETNPGPKSSSSLKQSRLTSEGASRRSSTECSAVRDPDPSSSGEGVLDSVTLTDIMTKLSCMDTNIKGVGEDVKNLKETVDGLKDELHDMKERVCDLQKENDALKSENCEMKDRMTYLEKKVDDLEGRSKRNNLIFYGIPRRENETKRDCENMVHDVLTQKLNMSQPVEFDRIHRLSTKPDSPIIGRCTFYKDKEEIMKAKRKLKDTSIFTGEDYTQRVRDVRKKLGPHLKAARESQKRATMIFDHLLIDGKKFALDGEDQLREIK